MSGEAADAVARPSDAEPSAGDGGSSAPSVPLRIGQRVNVVQFAGIVRFLGETKFASGRWVGVELDEAVGKNNGTVQDVAYFSCRPKHGIFVRETVVKPADAPAFSPEARGAAAAVEEPPAVPAAAEEAGAEKGSAGDQDAGSDDGSGSEGEAVESARTAGGRRRYGVSAAALRRGLTLWAPPFHEKDPQERAQLSEMIRTSHDTKLQMLFGSVRAETFEKVVDAMFPKRVPAGEKLIRIGDDGDYFYIVRRGQFDIHARRKDPLAEDAPGASVEPQLVKVFEAGAGFAFGELALLYNAPRSATIQATEESEVWCLEREAFQRLLVQSSQDQFKEYSAFIQRCDIFHELSKEQAASLAEVLEEEDFEEDEAVLEQGGRDSKMFIVRRGEAVACIKGDQGEVEVKRYKEGDYFGEIALLLGEPRKASVYAVGALTCMYITRDTFNRVLGPLRNFLQRNIDKYQKYQDAIDAAHQFDESNPTTGKRSSLRTTSDHDPLDEIFEGGAQSKGASPGRTKRYRIKEVQADVAYPEKAVQEDAGTPSAEEKQGQPGAPAAAAGASPAGEEAAAPTVPACGAAAPAGESKDDQSGGPAMSLKDKVAADFQNPALVSPCDSFLVPSSPFQMFGGLRLGQKFTHDKVVVASTKVKPTQDGLQDTYSWKGPCWLTGSTQTAVLCQKGQKSASDPTPNQDNYFVLHVGSVGIYGVCDGHGPFGHLVSFRLVQTLPHLVATNKNFGKDWSLALKEAFLDAQSDLVRFCLKHDVNLEASGAAGSVLVFEGPQIHVAHIGDAGAMVASYNRRDSRVIFGTKDHKPQNPEERERLEAAGSEVRELDKDNFRIYIKGTNFPGLTMSRAFGDTACAGVLREPEYHTFFMQPGDEYYAIIASDGIWEFLEYEEVVGFTAKKLRLKGPVETARFLTEASRKRWAYCCGEYCDDITVLLVQWNVKDKGGSSEENYSLTVTRDE